MAETKFTKIKELFWEYRFSLLFFIVLLIMLILRSGRFAPDPEVEAVPDNSYASSLHIVANSNNSPYSFVDEDGNGQGFDIELVTLIANRLQMNLVIDYLPWNECIDRITNHEADLLLTCDYASKFEGSDNLVKTQPVIRDDFVVYSRDPVFSPAELKGRKIAVPPDVNVMQKLNVLGLSETCTAYMDNVSTMKALLLDEVDYAIVRQSVGAVLLKDLRKEGLRTNVKAYIKVGENPMCLALDGAKAELSGPVNEAIDLFLLDGTIESLKEKWLTTFVRPYSFTETLENNRWFFLLFILYLVFSANAFFRNKRRWLQEKEQKLEKEQMMQQQIQKALDEAQAANKAKTSFLHSMSHDIRTPMNAIMGYTDLAIKHMDETEQVKDYLSKVRCACSHLLSLINDVLSLSRIESGKTTLSENEESLPVIVSSLEDMVQVDVIAKKLNLSVDCSGITDKNVVCDRLHLNQVLLNVLSNAVKYTPEEGTICMTVNQKKTWGKKTGTYQFTIKDNGIGMSREYLSTIYEPFTREQSASVSDIQGTGLGMSIARKIVDMMGGKIEIQSEPDKGTEVTITVDLKISSKQKDGDAGEDELDLSAVPEFSSDLHFFEGKKLLLVEDNAFNREIMAEILEGYGFIIDTAENGSVALEKLASASSSDYDLILMDVQMPVMDGFAATRRIRELKNDVADIPIIAMTADAFEEDRKMALEAGMNDHLSKPVDFKSMEKVLSEYLI